MADDEPNGRVGLARVEWRLGNIEAGFARLTGRVEALYDQGVLLRVVDLENKVKEMLTDKATDQRERGKERRGNWAQMAFLVGGVVLGVLANYVRSGK